MALNAAKVLIGTADQQTTGAIRNGAVITEDMSSWSFAQAETALGSLTASGYVSEDGLELTPEYTTADIKEWNGNTVRTVLEAFNGTIKWSLIQQDYESWVQAIGDEYVTKVDATTTAGEQLHIKMGSHLAPARAWGFAMRDGDARIIVICPNAQVTTLDSITFKSSEAIALPVTLSCYDDGHGNPIHIFVDDGVKTA